MANIVMNVCAVFLFSCTFVTQSVGENSTDIASENIATPLPEPTSGSTKNETATSILGISKPSYNKGNGLVAWLLGSNVRTQEKPDTEYRSFDGWHNNLAHQEWGSVETPLIRLVPADYSDGIYKPSGELRPNALLLSEAISKSKTGTVSSTGKTAFLAYFGHQVIQEMSEEEDPGCPPEYISIKVPKTHFYYENMKHTEMPFVRSRYSEVTGQSPNNPRQQMNTVTSWLDGSTIYGTSNAFANSLRSFVNGTLRAMERDHSLPSYNDWNLPMKNFPPPGLSPPKPQPASKLLQVGNLWGNQDPFTLSMQVLWFRWHNLIAEKLAEDYPHWSDERIFQEARKWVVASQQKIIVKDWLPAFLGEGLSDYLMYDPHVDPSLSQLFYVAASKYLYTLNPAAVYKRKRDCSVDIRLIRVCNSYWNNQEHLLSGGFEEIILGLTSQAAEKEDTNFVEDIQKYYFGSMEFTRRDLLAMIIQRGRDHGIPDYLSVRRELGLKADFKGFNEMAKELWPSLDSNSETINELRDLYQNNMNDIDVFLGGLLETTPFGPGELFRYVILNQFRRVRDGDRLWFENLANRLFEEHEIQKIQLLTITDIIRAVTTISEDEIQPNAFQLPREGNELKHAACAQKLSEHSYQCDTDSRQSKKATCRSLPPLINKMEPCTPPHTFDYFTGSEFSYIATFVVIGLLIVSAFLVQALLIRWKKQRADVEKMESCRKNLLALNKHTTLAREWCGFSHDLQPVEIELQREQKRMTIKKFGASKGPMRIIDLKNTPSVVLNVSYHSSEYYLLLKIPKEYDLILSFDHDDYQRENFISQLDIFLGEIGVGRERREVDLTKMLRNAYTKEKRQRHLEMFFRALFSHAFGIAADKDIADLKGAKEIIHTELTQYEFAEALGLRHDSMFVKQMFALVDKDSNGYISFREFLDMMIIFAKGSADQKAKLMFDMYDITRTGKLSKDEFCLMIRSMLELANQSVSQEQMEHLIVSMFSEAGLCTKKELDLADFIKLLGDYKDEFGYVELNLDVSSFQSASPKQGTQKRTSALVRANNTVVRAYSYFGDQAQVKPREPTEPKLHIETQKRTQEPGILNSLARFVDERKQHIFWLFLYTAIVILLFVNKAYEYGFEKEDGGLRQIAGYGVALTRGTATAMMFTYSTLLLTVSRNIITFLRETFVHHYIPFDAAISFHKYIAVLALISAVIHSVGHAINFYHMSTQPVEDINCLFRELSHNSDELPKFTYWAFQTVTGTTGLLLVLLLATIYIFALSYSRRHIFNAFWATHNLYPLVYILMFLHGLGRVIQEPILHKFITIPLAIFLVDRLISLSRKKVELSVVKAVHHPSEVTYLEIKRPPNFEYKSGQWMRIACVSLNTNEYHPFTIASAPNEENLQLYIRAVGPFTKNIRRIYNPDNLKSHPYPKVYIDGPYGEGHQDWFRQEIAVLVGGGIGVTPFASILKEIAFRSSTIHSKIPCKKVFFIWVTRTQKQFEWLVDIIRDVESKDTARLVSTHIFITQFYQKFDLRTTMLYICERHFQRISNKSLFTGLTAKTHFGRPDFVSFFDSLNEVYPKVNRVGVFSCGPAPMTRSVEEACDTMNHKEGAIFVHHSENF